MKRLLGHIELKLYIVIDEISSIVGVFRDEESALECADSSNLRAEVHLYEDYLGVSEVFEVSEDKEYVINRLELGNA